MVGSDAARYLQRQRTYKLLMLIGSMYIPGLVFIIELVAKPILPVTIIMLILLMCLIGLYIVALINHIKYRNAFAKVFPKLVPPPRNVFAYIRWCKYVHTEPFPFRDDQFVNWCDSYNLDPVTLEFKPIGAENK